MQYIHLSAFIWLRWRLLVNGWRRAGLANFVNTMFLAIAAVVAAVPIFADAIFGRSGRSWPALSEARRPLENGGHARYR